MYKPCKQVLTAASNKVRQGDTGSSRMLLSRLSACENTSTDCPYRAECRNMTCLMEEMVEAA